MITIITSQQLDATCICILFHPLPVQWGRDLRLQTWGVMRHRKAYTLTAGKRTQWRIIKYVLRQTLSSTAVQPKLRYPSARSRDVAKKNTKICKEVKIYHRLWNKPQFIFKCFTWRRFQLIRWYSIGNKWRKADRRWYDTDRIRAKYKVIQIWPGLVCM